MDKDFYKDFLSKIFVKIFVVCEGLKLLLLKLETIFGLPVVIIWFLFRIQYFG